MYLKCGSIPSDAPALFLHGRRQTTQPGRPHGHRGPLPVELQRQPNRLAFHWGGERCPVEKERTPLFGLFLCRSLFLRNRICFFLSSAPRRGRVGYVTGVYRNFQHFRINGFFVHDFFLLVLSLY